MWFIGSLCVCKVGFLVNNDRKNGDMARRFSFADDFLYVKLMTEKSKKKMSFCKICLLCSLHRKFLFSQ